MAESARRISSGQTALLPLPAAPKAPCALLPLHSPQKLKGAFAEAPSDKPLGAEAKTNGDGIIHTPHHLVVHPSHVLPQALFVQGADLL